MINSFFIISVDVDFINFCLINDKMTELVNPMDVFCGLRCTEVESGWAQFREVNVCGGALCTSRCATLVWPEAIVLGDPRK